MKRTLQGLVPWWQTAGQSAPNWTASQTDGRVLVDILPPPEHQGLLDIRVIGENIECEVTYGTSSQVKIYGLRSPLRLALPGSVNVFAKKIDAGALAWAKCSVQPVTSGPMSFARSLGTSAVLAPVTAVRATAINAASLTVAGVVVALGAGESMDIITPTSLTAGSVIWEHEI